MGGQAELLEGRLLSTAEQAINLNAVTANTTNIL